MGRLNLAHHVPTAPLAYVTGDDLLNAVRACSPDLCRRFRTGRPSLDLVHAGDEGEYAVWEIVHNAEDLGRWLALILEVDQIHATAEDLPAMRALRARSPGWRSPPSPGMRLRPPTSPPSTPPPR